MGNELLASKIVIQEEEPALRQVVGAPTAVAGFVGVAERGPIGVATQLTSVEDYRRVFGGYTGAGELAQAVDGFFLNGGSQCWVVRTVHYTDVTTPGTKTSAAATITLQSGGGTPAATLRVDGRWDGTYANALSARIVDATSGEAGRFNLQVVQGNVVLEVWPNLSMNDTDPSYVELVINDPDNGSRFLVVTDLDATGDPTAQRPANGTFALAGGTDGLTGLADTDFTGAAGATGRTGLRALDTVAALSLLAIPGRATSVVHNAMLTYCQVTRAGAVFAVLDPPATSSATAIITHVETTAALINLSEFGAIYWPRILVANPTRGVFGNTTLIPVAPSGYVCGVMARNDAAREGGVFNAPAGVENGIIFGCLGFEGDDTLDEGKRDLVYPKRINPITTSRGQARYIDGSRTLKGNGNFPSVPERRGVIFIEQSLKDALQVARHRNNDATLRNEAARTTEVFLETQMRAGAFRTKDPATAFFVDFGEGLNTPAVIFANKLVGRIGLATQKPAEFVVLRFSQDTRAFATGT